MLAEVRRVLDVIEDALLKHDVAAADLAALLSALRSKDNELDYDPLKQVTTAPLRTAIFPRIGKDYHTPDCGTHGRCWYMGQPSRLRGPFEAGQGGHFEVHYNMALEALKREDTTSGRG